MAGKTELEYREIDPSELAVLAELFDANGGPSRNRVNFNAAVQNFLLVLEPWELGVGPFDTDFEVNFLCDFQQGKPQEVVRVGPKGYCIHKKYQTLASDFFSMELKEGDVWVTSFPRSGTTWTQELVWLVANDFDYQKAAAVLLKNRYASLERPIFFDERSHENAKSIMNDKELTDKKWEEISNSAVKVLATMPSPRFIKSHLPMSLMPPNVLESSKVVYVARDPRDVAVSCFHISRLLKFKKYKGNVRQTWDLFLKDLYVLTPYFEHVKEAWAMRDHPNMLFLFYEDLSKDLQASVRKVADFLGKEVTPAQMERLCEHLHIDNFKQNKSVNLEELRELGLLDSREQFIRKGKSGGWRDYFDEEMTQQAERWIKKNLADTDLRFPSMSN